MKLLEGEFWMSIGLRGSVGVSLDFRCLGQVLFGCGTAYFVVSPRVLLFLLFRPFLLGDVFSLVLMSTDSSLINHESLMGMLMEPCTTY